MEPWTNWALSGKKRELICIAIDCTVTHMFEPGLVIHIRHALAKGARRDKILEVFHLASLTGLEGYVAGVRALHVLAALALALALAVALAVAVAVAVALAVVAAGWLRDLRLSRHWRRPTPLPVPHTDGR